MEQQVPLATKTTTATTIMKPLHPRNASSGRLIYSKALMTSLVLIMTLLQASSFLQLVAALPKAAISTESSKSPEIIGTTLSSTDKTPVGTSIVSTQTTTQSQLQQQQQSQQQVPLAEELALNDDEIVEKTSHANTAEKLKRGLSNFINQTSNPATFFVPPAPQKSPPIKPVSEIGEPSAIINNDPAVEVFINRPRRLTHSRPIGGPLRWGRR